MVTVEVAFLWRHALLERYSELLHAGGPIQVFEEALPMA